MSQPDTLATTIAAQARIVSLGTIPGNGSSTALINSLLSAADLADVAGSLELTVTSPTVAVNVFAGVTGTAAVAIPAGGSFTFKITDSPSKLKIRSNTASTVTDAVGLFYCLQA